MLGKGTTSRTFVYLIDHTCISRWNAKPHGQTKSLTSLTSSYHILKKCRVYSVRSDSCILKCSIIMSYLFNYNNLCLSSMNTTKETSGIRTVSACRQKVTYTFLPDARGARQVRKITQSNSVHTVFYEMGGANFCGRVYFSLQTSCGFTWV